MSDGAEGLTGRLCARWASSESRQGRPIVDLVSSAAACSAPLLPAGEEEEAQYLEHVLEPKQWPQLRGSSVSTRRITPGLLAQELAGAAAPLSPREGAAGSSAPGSQPEAMPAEAGEAAAALPTAAASKKAAAAAAVPQSGRYVRASVAGAVNAVIGLPLQLSFAAIIFRDPFFRPRLGALVKLVFLSSAIHQLAFVALSTLPFAVGERSGVAAPCALSVPAWQRASAVLGHPPFAAMGG